MTPRGLEVVIYTPTMKLSLFVKTLVDFSLEE